MESIYLLEGAGIDFDILNRNGIRQSSFAESLIPSGLIFNENVTWVTFHGIYDFAYLLRLTTNMPLPESETVFFNELETYFINYYDTRQMINSYSWLKGSLTKIASSLDIERVGAVHQAGSDSLITGKLYHKLYENFPENEFIVEKNKLFGLSMGFSADK